MNMPDTSNADVQASLVAILAEVIDYPKKRSSSPNSSLPNQLIVQASTALAAAGFGVSSLQEAGGTQ